MYYIHSDKKFSGASAFYLMDEKGFDISICAELCAEKGMLMEWDSFFVVAGRNKNYKKKKGMEKLFNKCKMIHESIWTDTWWEIQIKKDPENYGILERN